MGTAVGPVHLLELCDQKLLEFVCNVDNKDLVWLEEIEEEAVRMFTRDFSKEPELMPKTPSQKSRTRKRRVSYVQDENRDPIRKRLSRKEHQSSQRGSRSSQRGSRQLRRKDKVEKLVVAAGDSPVLRRVTRATAAAAPLAVPISESPDASAQPVLVPVVQIRAKERRSAEEQLRQALLACESGEEATPTKPRPMAVSSLVTTPQDSQGPAPGAGRSVSKLRIAQTSPGPRSSPASPWHERALAPIQPHNYATPTDAHLQRRSVRRSLLATSTQKAQVSLTEKFSLVAKQELPVRRSSRIAKGVEDPPASARIICHSYLERLLNVEVPPKVGSLQKAPEPSPQPSSQPEDLAEPEVLGTEESPSWPHSTTQVAISTLGGQAVAMDPHTPPKGFSEAQADQADGPKEKPLSARRKRSYRQAVSEQDEELQLDEEDEEPRNKTPSPPCPANKVVRPLRTFLHTVQRNQLLMTPTSAPRSSVMKSFIKRNTPLRVDPKEKERQRLETLRRKQEAEQLRRQKVEEDKRRRLEEVKLKREERLRKVLQARERAEQIKEEKKKQMEQKFAQIEEKSEKAKEERLAEEKARRKAAARKQEEVEARRKQEDEARRLRWQQQEEERRRLEQQQRRKEEEQQRKAAEAKREQERRREQERLQAEREQQEREKALRLQRELEEKKKREEQQRLAEQRLQEEQERKAKEVASKALNVTVDVQSPACTSYQMTPQGPRNTPKINPDNYGMDLNSDDSTDDEAHPRKPIPAWARGTQLSQAIIHQYYQSWDLLDLFGSILPLDLEDIFKKNKPRYHKRTSSAVWNSPPLQGPRGLAGLAISLKKY